MDSSIPKADEIGPMVRVIAHCQINNGLNYHNIRVDWLRSSSKKTLNRLDIPHIFMGVGVDQLHQSVIHYILRIYRRDLVLTMLSLPSVIQYNGSQYHDLRSSRMRPLYMLPNEIDEIDINCSSRGMGTFIHDSPCPYDV